MAIGTTQKSMSTAVLLWFFLGAFGAHRFYLGTSRRWAMALTLGGLGFWALLDVFRLRKFVDAANAEVTV
jgi:TM2 domain-containing membrane protein YozV